MGEERSTISAKAPEVRGGTGEQVKENKYNPASFLLKKDIHSSSELYWNY